MALKFMCTMSTIQEKKRVPRRHTGTHTPGRLPQLLMIYSEISFLIEAAPAS